MKRELKFRAYIKELDIMLCDVSVFNENLIGISEEDFSNELKKKNLYMDEEGDIYLSNPDDSDDDKYFTPLYTVLPVSDEWVNIEDAEVMQFTGLKDKNGEEVWEGDVVKYLKGSLVEPEESPFAIEAIKWFADGFAVDTAYSLCELSEDCEVIGDIFQNPELLENKK